MFARSALRGAVVLSISLNAAGAAAEDHPKLVASREHASDATAAPLEPPPADVAPAAKTSLLKAYQLESGVASTYVSRGKPQYVDRSDPGSISAASVTLDHLGPGALTLALGSIVALSRYRRQGGAALELDLGASYAIDLTPRLQASVGYGAELFPKAIPVDGSHEIFGTLTLNDWVVTPSLSVYAEVVRQMGLYATFAISRKLERGTLSLTPQASIGFAGYDAVLPGMNDATAGVAGQWTFAEPAYVVIRAAYSYVGTPAASLAEGDASFARRSVPWTMVALGVQR